MTREHVVILHPLAARDGPEKSYELKQEIEERLPNLSVDVAVSMTESEELISSAEIVLTKRLDDELLDEASKLQWIQALSAGVDFYDLDQLASEDILLTNVSGLHPKPVAEQVFCYMLAFERSLLQGIRQQTEGVWEHYLGGELSRKTLGIIGVGEIGSRIAEVASVFQMNVLGIKRDPATDIDNVDQLWGPDQLEKLLKKSDYVVVSCPLTEETRSMLSYDELATMQSSSVLINIARGNIVDQDALIRILQRGRIRGAALDVFEQEPLPADSPLWDLSNVILTPHMAGKTPHNSERRAEIFVQNYRSYSRGEMDAMPTRVL